MHFNDDWSCLLGYSLLGCMSTFDVNSPWLVRIVDSANPILVKELRQSLKSRQFVITFMLLLTAAWLVSVFGLLMFHEQVQYGPAGRYFFIGFYIALAVATLLIVPFGAYKSLQAERDFNTFEILSVSTITPQQIVRGRLLSALVQCLIFYSAITPFMAFASTMQGFDAPRAAYVLVVTLIISMMFSMAALMVSTLSKQRATQGLLSMVLVGQLIGAAITACSLAWIMIFQTWFSITHPLFWQVNAAAFVALVSYFVLFQQIATANLTFESANHSTGIRITAAVQFWMLWLVTFGYCWWNKIKAREELIFAFAFVSIAHWAAFGFAFTAELDSLSRRIRREFPKNSFLRLLMVPFLPGGARGYLFLLFQIASIWLLFAIGMSYFSRSGWFGGSFWDRTYNAFLVPDKELAVVTGMCLYLVIYNGINAALARWGQMISEIVKPAHTRVVTFLVFMAAIVGPQILWLSKVIDLRQGRYHYVQVLDPYNSSIQLYFQTERTAPVILSILAILAILSILVNLMAMLTSTARVLNSHVVPRKPSDIRPFLK
jgi:hypothetical protein